MNHTDTVYQFVSPRIKFPTKPLSFCRALGALHGRHSVSSSLSPPLLNVRKRLATLRHSFFFFLVYSSRHRQRMRTSAIYYPATVLRPVCRLPTLVWSRESGLKLLHPDEDTVNGLIFREKKPRHHNCECLKVWQGLQPKRFLEYTLCIVINNTYGRQQRFL